MLRTLAYTAGPCNPPPGAARRPSLLTMAIFDRKTGQWDNNPTAERQPDTAVKKARVVELRRQRLPWAEIAKDVGVSERVAHRYYDQALADIPARHVDE